LGQREENPEISKFLRWAQLTCAGEVAAMVAHDINNAITGVMSYAELAQMDLPTWSEAGPYLDKALEQARRVNALANRLLTLSHEAEPYLCPQSLQDSLEIACGLLRRRLEKDRIAFEHTLDVEGVQIVADAGRLMLIWLGLLLAARRALLSAEPDSERRLSLTARRTGGASPHRSQIDFEVAAAGVHRVRFLQETVPATGSGMPTEREGMLYTAAKTCLAELNGTLGFRSGEDRLYFAVDLPDGV
jgi:signal transduction histidine kinase